MANYTPLQNYVAYGLPVVLTAYSVFAFLFALFKIMSNFAVEGVFDILLALSSFIAAVLAAFLLWTANYAFGFVTVIICLCFMTLTMTGRAKFHSGPMLVFWAVWFASICNFVLLLGPGPLGVYSCDIYRTGSTQSAMCKQGWLTYVAIVGTVILGCSGVIGICLVFLFTAPSSFAPRP